MQSAGAALLSSAAFTGPGAPFVAIAGAALELLAAMGVGSGCGQTCVLSTAYANKAEVIFRQNANAYFALPAPRTVGQQAAALAIFDAIWSDLSQQCGNPSLGNAGARCISDRQAGACTWKQTGASPWPGGPAVGDCWNWFNAYRDPIANDPVVADTVASVASSVSGDLNSILGTSGSTVPLLVLAALVIWAVT
jgi:hypothetical protein